MNEVNTLSLTVKSLDLSTAFAASVMTIVLVGILIAELFTTIQGEKARRAALAFVVLIILTETALILDLVANTLSSLFNLLIVEVVVAVLALSLAVVIVTLFQDLMRKNLLYAGIIFGILATLGVVGTLIWSSPVARIIGILGTNGVIIMLYLIVLTFILDYRKKHNIK